jgi:hypothetical protein
MYITIKGCDDDEILEEAFLPVLSDCKHRAVYTAPKSEIRSTSYPHQIKNVRVNKEITLLHLSGGLLQPSKCLESF